MRLVYLNFFLLVVSVCEASHFSTLCGKAQSELVFLYQRANIGLESAPGARFNQLYPKLNDLKNRNGFAQFELEIADFFGTAPELRNIGAFARRWGMTEREILDVMIFYGQKVFPEYPHAISDPHVVYSRIRETSRNHYLSDADTQLKRRYRYYMFNLTNKSVPEMREELNQDPNAYGRVTEGDVYADLVRFRLSILEAFERNLGSIGKRAAEERLRAFGNESIIPTLNSELSILENSRRLRKEGLNLEQVSDVLGVGSKALQFIWHHVGIEKRGNSWDRVLDVGGEKIPEVVYLVQLHKRGLSHQQISDHINQNASGSLGRTATAVKDKLSDLGLSESRENARPREVFHSEYGYLKVDGKLVDSTVLRFIVDHRNEKDSWLAEQLGVAKSTLSKFYQRHNVTRGNGPKRPLEVSREHSGAESTTLSRYQRQREALSKVFEWMEKNDYKFPSRSDFGMGEGQIRVNRIALLGQAVYSPAGKQSHLRIFDSTEAYLLALKEFAKEKGHNVYLFRSVFYGEPTEVLRQVWKDEIIEVFLDRSIGKEVKVPTQGDFRQSNPDSDRVHGQGRYALGGNRHHLRIFDSREDFLIALKRKADENGRVFYLHSAKLLSPPSDKMRELWQEEVLNLSFQWMSQNNWNTPKFSQDFGKGENKIPLTISRVGGSSEYSSRGQRYNYRIFDSAENYWFALKKYMASRGKQVLLINVSIREKPSESLRNVWKLEALELGYRWMKENSMELPKRNYFGTGENRIPILQKRLFGLYEYAHGEKQHHRRIFDSYEDYIEALKRYSENPPPGI